MLQFDEKPRVCSGGSDVVKRRLATLKALEATLERSRLLLPGKGERLTRRDYEPGVVQRLPATPSRRRQ